MNGDKKEEPTTYDTAKHVLWCRHAIGKNGRDYEMRCEILKTMPDGRLKIRVFGERYWWDRRHVSRIRYVDSNRVSVNPTQNKGE